MKSKVSVLLALSLTMSFTVGCGSDSSGGGKNAAGGEANLRTAELSADALIDQLGPTSSFTTTRELYVGSNVNFVSDIFEDNTKVTTCILTLPGMASAEAYWIPAGTTFPIVKGKIGADRSFALAMAEGEPFDVARLSCWTIEGDTQPLTIQFLRDALAPSFTVDARQ